ncbi:diacylglycerol kinase family protein [Bacillus sp. V3B]|uniref:diacylglycerol kinase family protein n=1 Tax=Bacillus sp. V3B TaxID=2804915 RepID=UPI00210E6F5A|nr:diacylglycerol kinase family protein [Bacillus sp. V3B]MCQ6273640.1 diacylglycerol kinase family protein [Bacillus sp. V3B]
MNSDFKGRRKRGLLRPFTFAIVGILHALRNERNMKIHTVVVVIVMILGLLYRLSTVEWMFIIFAIGGVLALELINTALERVVDLVTKNFHPLAKQAKDVAAGAVFIYAIVSVLIGCIIFLPKIFEK